MAENYNLNPNFGLNVSSKGTGSSTGYKPSSVPAKDVLEGLSISSRRMNNIFDVFDGKVANEISMYSRQAMLISMNLNAADD
ncbi:MAG: hypothetical protein IJW73_00025, partial [Candidatus Gastranaerophilales bacterium]|nr:hypothetical protein [Candidatus Gastranaerophilales bacterium]